MKSIFNATIAILLALVHIGCGSKSSAPAPPEVSGILTPVKWSFTVNKISDTEAELVMKATIDKGWHLYSMNQEIPEGPETGPMSLTVEFEKNANYSLDGPIIESTPENSDDPVFNMKVKFFEHEAVYRQKIKILTKDGFSVTGLLNFQSCDDAMCIPPTDDEFKFEIPESAV